VIHYVLRPTKLFYYIRYSKNYHSCERNILLYQFIKKRDKIIRNNYRGVSLLPTTNTVLTNILPFRLTPNADGITGDHVCEFQRNRSNTEYVRQWRKKMGVKFKTAQVYLYISKRPMTQERNTVKHSH